VERGFLGARAHNHHWRIRLKPPEIAPAPVSGQWLLARQGAPLRQGHRPRHPVS
jgi:hypothetical protein